MMKKTLSLILAAAVLAVVAAPARAAQDNGFRLEVVVDGRSRPEMRHDGTIYVEALRGREYSLRLTNPLGCRVAVALAVDGLNTLDARHSDARSAAKWVLGPHETIEIPGWQVSSGEARRFYFTGERESYGAWLGKTEDLGVIEAVFYRERRPHRRTWTGAAPEASDSSAGAGRVEKRGAAECPSAAAPDDDYAATGIGERRDHSVLEVELELEDGPAAAVRIRYEFARELRRLGLRPQSDRQPLDRREGARGFDRYCPEP